MLVLRHSHNCLGTDFADAYLDALTLLPECHQSMAYHVEGGRFCRGNQVTFGWAAWCKISALSLGHTFDVSNADSSMVAQLYCKDLVAHVRTWHDNMNRGPAHC